MAGSEYRQSYGSNRPHSLKAGTKGANRYLAGEYVCSCGQTFPSIKKFEKHRGTERKRLALKG